MVILQYRLGFLVAGAESLASGMIAEDGDDDAAQRDR